jgi:hypothetical protein
MRQCLILIIWTTIKERVFHKKRHGTSKLRYLLQSTGILYKEPKPNDIYNTRQTTFESHH